MVVINEDDPLNCYEITVRVYCPNNKFYPKDVEKKPRLPRSQNVFNGYQGFFNTES